LAHANKRVLVVDTDFRRPSVLRLLGLQGEAGIAEVLRNGLAPGSAGIKVLPHGFVVLPTREPIDNPAQLLSSNSFREMLNAFDSQFDFLLFDSSPLADSADKNLLASLTNAALLVVRSEKTRSGDLGKAIAPLTEQQIFGVVLNCH
jgi:Mrp family chromosome partitioning ATPase